MPKIIGGSLEEHRVQTRQRVYDALVTLLDRSSFDAISMADLAAEAGIGRTAIYNHFRDKGAVIVGFASSETGKYLDRLAGVLDGIESPVERLAAYVRHHVETQGDQHFGFGPEVHARLSGEDLLAIRDHVQQVEAVVRGILEDGVRAGDFRPLDVRQTVRLIQACLQPRSVEADVVVDFVVGAVAT